MPQHDNSLQEDVSSSEEGGLSSESVSSFIYQASSKQEDLSSTLVELTGPPVGEYQSSQLSVQPDYPQITIPCRLADVHQTVWQTLAKEYPGYDRISLAFITESHEECVSESGSGECVGKGQEAGNEGREVGGQEQEPLDESARKLALSQITMLSLIDMPAGFHISQLPLADMTSLETLSLLFPKGEGVFKEIAGLPVSEADGLMPAKLAHLGLCLDSAFQLFSSEYSQSVLPGIGHIILDIEPDKAVTETELLIDLLTLLALSKPNLPHSDLTLIFSSAWDTGARYARLRLIASELSDQLESQTALSEEYPSPQVGRLWITLEKNTSSKFYEKLHGLCAFDLALESPGMTMSLNNLKLAERIIEVVQPSTTPEHYLDTQNASLQLFFAPPSPQAIAVAPEPEPEPGHPSGPTQVLAEFRDLFDYFMDVWLTRRLLVHNARAMFDQDSLDGLIKEASEDPKEQVEIKGYLTLYQFIQDLRDTCRTHFDKELTPESFIECPSGSDEPEVAVGAGAGAAVAAEVAASRAEQLDQPATTTSYQRITLTHSSQPDQPFYLFLAVHPRQATYQLCTATIIAC